MYYIATIKGKVSVHPSKFEMSKKDAIKTSLEEKLEGLVDKQIGIILAVTRVGEIEEAKIYPGNGSLHYPVEFDVLVYYPEEHEIVIGDVIDVTEFGVFVRIGPLDGMIHVSQLMDDFVSFDSKNAMFVGRETKWTLKEGDIVRARIISVSLGKEYKIGLTTRQPGLGGLHWKARKKEVGKPVKKAKKR
ncbi:MAG: DNA-directed RNA polymerase [Candidatus Aenigmatarchaeota archaeon]